jgi:two-component system, NarL family, nitrate/nitrite response regulator NarL
LAHDPTRVAVVDDHPLYRYAIEQVIAHDRDLALAGSFADGLELLDALDRLEADVVLLDLDLPGADGMSVLRRAVPVRPDVRFLILTADSRSETTYAALEAGAAGYLVKDLDEGGLHMALAAAASGEVVLPRRVQQGVVKQIRARAAASRPTLTAREEEVLMLTAEGLTACEAAQRMHVSAGTVKAHLGSIYEKLGAPDRAAAVARAMRLGLLA